MVLFRFPSGTVEKNLPANTGDADVSADLSLGPDDPLEQKMATLSSILAWNISWTEEPDGGKESDTIEPPPPPTHIHSQYTNIKFILKNVSIPSLG